jgi:hypothetical protein
MPLEKLIGLVGGVSDSFLLIVGVSIIRIEMPDRRVSEKVFGNFV